MNKKLTSALLCLVFAGCSTAAPTTDSDTAASSASSEMQKEDTKMMESKAYSGMHTDIEEENSTISFVGNSSLNSHSGEFTDFEAELTADDADPENFEGASLEVVINMTSAVTDSKGLDDHLLKDDFFAAETYPTASFTSTSIASTGEYTYSITGDLTVKGTTKQMTVPAEVTDEYIKIEFDLPRKEFGVGNDSYGDKLLDENVPVSIMLMFESHMGMMHDDEDGEDDSEEMMDSEQDEE